MPSLPTYSATENREELPIQGAPLQIEAPCTQLPAPQAGGEGGAPPPGNAPLQEAVGEPMRPYWVGPIAGLNLKRLPDFFLADQARLDPGPGRFLDTTTSTSDSGLGKT